MDDQGRKPMRVIDAHCSQFVQPLREALKAAGLWSVQSFDLRSTRALHEGCSCPNHGTDQCTCELIVLLVYRPVGGPLTLTLDGRNGKTFVFLADETGGTARLHPAAMIEDAVESTAQRFGQPGSRVDRL